MTVILVTAAHQACKPRMVEDSQDRGTPRCDLRHCASTSNSVFGYPDVKLMWSGEWNLFSYDNFWVTIAGTSFGDKAGANAWCDQQRLNRDHCFAKLISRTHPVEGSTGCR